MSENEIVGTIFQVRGQINFLWNFYVTACAIMIGWLFSGSINWSLATFRTVAVFFVIFAIINSSALHTEYQLLELALIDLIALRPDGNFMPQLAKTAGLGANGTLFVHIVADMLLLGLLRHRYVRAMRKHAKTGAAID